MGRSGSGHISAPGRCGCAWRSSWFKLYVGQLASFDKTYGGLGAVIVLLMWLFVTGLVVLVGSELDALTQPYSTRGNASPKPAHA